ncbi:MAG: GGDEF domain-containing protein [Acidobacteriia bacterium]|nr:GGDEF domain-containing protein [Terriglobia bacterium]
MMKSKILDLIRRKGIKELIRENYLLLPLFVLFVISSFGVYSPPLRFTAPQFIGVIAITVYSVAAFYRYILRLGGDFQYVEVVGALILAINFLVQRTGGLHSFWFGLYLLLMLAVGINYSLRISLLTVVRISLLEGFNALATAFRMDQHFETDRLLLWLLMLVLVAIVGEASLVILKRRLAQAEKELEAAAIRAEEEALERKKFLPVFARTIASGEPEMALAGGETGDRGTEFEDVFLEHLRTALIASHVCFFVRDNTGVFQMSWMAGEGTEFNPDASFVEGQGLLGYCAKNKTPLVGKRSPGTSARSWKVDFVYLKSVGDLVRAYLAEPVVHGASVAGVLVADRMESPDPEPPPVPEFTPEEERMMKSAVTILELEWKRNQTARAHRQSNELLTTFFRIISRMSSSLNVDDVSSLLLKESKALLNYETAAVALLSEDRNSYSLISAEGIEFDRDLRIPSDAKTWTYWSITSAEDALLLSDFQRRAGQMPIYMPGEPPLAVGSLLAIPLGPPSHRHGAFVLTHSQPGQFGSEVQQLLRLLCQHVAVIVENAINHRQMETLAATDELTHLPNHRSFQERIEEEISRSRRNKKPLSLLMVDIDHFKKLNDTYGHPFGDAVLGQLATILESCLRREDFAARYGGEEFAVVLPDTSREGARQSAERFRTEVGRTAFTYEGNSAQLSISAGIATYPRDATSKEQLIENADRALYVAKRTGRNRIAQYHVIETMQLPIEFSS